MSQDQGNVAADTDPPRAMPASSSSTNGVGLDAHAVAARMLDQGVGQHAPVLRRTSPGARGNRRRHARAAVGVLCLLAALGLALVGRSAFVVGAVVAGLLGAYLLHRTWLDRRTEALERLAGVDDLTGFGNQRILWEALADHIEAARRGPLSLVMVDVDGFKEVNDRYGHQVGDAVLRATAMSVREEVPGDGMCFRYGGDEMLVIAPGTVEEAACELAEAIRGAVANQRLGLPAVTVSCGVAEADPSWGPWELMDSADRALRGAKRTGRNRVVCFAEVSSEGLEPQQHEDEVDVARRTALEVAAATLLARDSGTAGHADDVVKLAGSIASRLGIKGAQHDEVLAAARLHDIGKVAIGPEILNKPGPLTAEEWTVMRDHTPIGERILRAVPHMAEVATIVRHSHEHYDGSGYPDGLRREAIPLASRIILCADAFHAIRSDRPYRRGRSAADAMRELRANAGTQFDPKVVDALEKEAHDLRGRLQSTGGDPRRVASPRLLALLLTLVVGGGSAFAASDPLRHWASSLVGGGGHHGTRHETADRGCHDSAILACVGAVIEPWATGAAPAGRATAEGPASRGSGGGAPRARSGAPTTGAKAITPAGAAANPGGVGAGDDARNGTAEPAPEEAGAAVSAREQLFVATGSIALDESEPRPAGAKTHRAKGHGRGAQGRQTPERAHGRGPSAPGADRQHGKSTPGDHAKGGTTKPGKGSAPNQAGGRPDRPGGGGHAKNGNDGLVNSQGDSKTSARTPQSGAWEGQAATGRTSEDPASAGASSAALGADVATPDAGVGSSIEMVNQAISPLLDSVAGGDEASSGPLVSSLEDVASSAEALAGTSEALPATDASGDMGQGDGEALHGPGDAVDPTQEPPPATTAEPAPPPDQPAEDPSMDGATVPY